MRSSSWKFLALVAIAALLAACKGSVSMSDAEHLAKAREFQSQGKLREAIIESKNAIQKNPKNGEARWLLGEIYVELGNGADAEKELLKAEELGIGMESLKVALGRAYVAQGKYEETLKRIEAGPNSSVSNRAKILEVRGNANLLLGKHDEACALYAESVKADGKYIPAFLGQARCAMAKDDRDGARMRINEAIAIDPRHAEALALLGDVERYAKRIKEAETVYDRALAIRPHLVPALLGRAAVRIESGKLAGAGQDLATVLKEHPNAYLAHYLRGQLLQRENKFAEAKAAYAEALRVAPDHLPSTLGLGLMHVATGGFEQAQVYLGRFSRVFPDNADVRAMLAYAQARAGNTKQAQEVLATFKGAEPSDPKILSRIGAAYLLAGDRRLGTEYFGRAVEKDPGAAEQRLQLASALMATGQGQQAIQQLERAVELDPKSATAEFMLVQALTREKKYEEALKAAERLGSKDKTALPRALRGAVLLAKGDAGGARSAFEEALRVQPGYAPAAHNLAALALREGKPDEARAYLEGVLKHNKKDVATTVQLYALEMRANRRAQARALLETAIASQPEAAQPRLLLAQHYLSSNNSLEAIKALELLRPLQAANANNPELLGVQGAAYLVSGDVRAARAAYAKLVELQPSSADAHFRLASAQGVGGDIKAARQSLERALELDTKHFAARLALTRLDLSERRDAEVRKHSTELRKLQPDSLDLALVEAELLAREKRMEEAFRVLEAARRGHPESARAVFALARARWITGGRTQAINLVEQWCQDHPADRAATRMLADFYLAEKQSAKAIALFEELLKRAPEDPVLLNNLAALLQDQDPGRAREYAEKAYNIKADSPAIMDTLGVILIRKEGDRERGLRLLEKATELAPDAGEVRLHYAKGLIMSGSKERARKQLQQLLGSRKVSEAHKSAARELMSQLH